MIYKKSFLLFLYLSVFTGQFLFAQDNIPENSGMVNDFAGVLTNSEVSHLENILRRYRDTTSNEIAIAIFSSLGNHDLESYTGDVARKWGVGGKHDNGVLIAIYINEHKFRIEVGRGLEGVLPDLMTHKIYTEQMRPYMKQGNFYNALLNGTAYIIKAIGGEYKELPKIQSSRKKKKEGDWIKSLIILAVIFGIMYLISRRNNRGGGSGGYGGPGGFFFFNSGSGFGGHSGGWGGSGGGSDWGGFGGGDFGGGGSSGDW